MTALSPAATVGINGIGRIGKLLVWVLSSMDEQSQLVVSTGRHIGKSLEDLATYLSYDSTYGPYSSFVSGFRSGSRIEIKKGDLYINGKKLIWLNEAPFRSPGNIPWSEHGVELVFETTGTLTDPTGNDERSLRGHLNHAKKVVLSAPFKIKNKGALMPDDAVTLVGGVNFDRYDPALHNVISNASCTTNCCAPPIRALVDHFGDRMVSYALTTVHAATNTQSVLDSLPKDGDTDTRKRRSIVNNIIPTSTGAANAVLEVIPEIRELGIGSQASAIRVMSNTGSIVVLDVTILGEYDNLFMHDIFKKYVEKNPDIMKFSREQLVSSDIIGSSYSTIYDSPFTHHRTSRREDRYYTMFDLNFWYDNEFGYVCSLIRLYELLTGKR